MMEENCAYYVHRHVKQKRLPEGKPEHCFALLHRIAHTTNTHTYCDTCTINYYMIRTCKRSDCVTSKITWSSTKSVRLQHLSKQFWLPKHKDKSHSCLTLPDSTLSRLRMLWSFNAGPGFFASWKLPVVTIHWLFRFLFLDMEQVVT